MEQKCNICKSPYHPSTGHYISETMVWCGPCTKSWVADLKAMQNRRWGKCKFYDFATVPPEATMRKFQFFLKERVKTAKPHFFETLSIKIEAVNEYEAFEIFKEMTNNSELFCWSELGLKLEV
jgi:hypothetical protein